MLSLDTYGPTQKTQPKTKTYPPRVNLRASWWPRSIYVLSLFSGESVLFLSFYLRLTVLPPVVFTERNRWPCSICILSFTFNLGLAWYICIHVCVCMCACMCVPIAYMYTCVCVYVCVYVRAYSITVRPLVVFCIFRAKFNLSPMSWWPCSIYIFCSI